MTCLNNHWTNDALWLLNDDRCKAPIHTLIIRYQSKMWTWGDRISVLYNGSLLEYWGKCGRCIPCLWMNDGISTKHGTKYNRYVTLASEKFPLRKLEINIQPSFHHSYNAAKFCGLQVVEMQRRKTLTTNLRHSWVPTKTWGRGGAADGVQCCTQNLVLACSNLWTLPLSREASDYSATCLRKFYCTVNIGLLILYLLSFTPVHMRKQVLCSMITMTPGKP